MLINKRNFIDYTFLLLLLAVSGIPYFSTTVLYIPLFAIFLISFLMRGYKLDKEFVYLLLFLTIITVSQTIVFDIFSFQNSLGVYLRIILAYLVVKILNEKFLGYYINIMYYLAMIGTLLYTTLVIFPSAIPFMKSIVPIFNFLNISGSIQQTLIVYNFNALEGFRNSGPFWEPGAFGGYLILAIIFTFFKSDIADKKKKLLVFTIALLTTLSTTAYIALAVFLFFYYLRSIKNIFIKLFVVLIIIYGAYYAFFNFDFLGKKIETQLQTAKNFSVYGSNKNTQRFMDILRDIHDFKGHEIAGRGFNPYTRYSYEPQEQIRTVGLTDILVKMGTPFFIYMMFLMYKSICAFVKNSIDKKGTIYCIGGFLTILMTLMSEVYFNFPMYWSLLFIFLIYKPQKESIMI